MLLLADLVEFLIIHFHDLRRQLTHPVIGKVLCLLFSHCLVLTCDITVPVMEVLPFMLVDHRIAHIIIHIFTLNRCQVQMVGSASDIAYVV